MSCKLISDVIHGSIEFSDFESFLMRHTLVNRLHKILQDSTAFLVYPCNRTSRFEHSLGTMHCASNMLINAFSNSDAKTLKDVIQEIDNTILKKCRSSDSYKDVELHLSSMQDVRYQQQFYSIIRTDLETRSLDKENLIETLYVHKSFVDHLYNVLGADFSNRHMMCIFNGSHCKDENENYKKLFLLILQAVRIYGFLHDVGHLPFSHIFEGALGNLHWEKTDPVPPAKDNSDLISQIYNLDLKKELHEEISCRIMDFIITEAANNELKSFKLTKSSAHIYRSHVLIILNMVLKEIVKCEKKSVFEPFHKIVDGNIDADRIDFSMRQLHSSGHHVGTEDCNRVIKMLRIVKDNSSASYLLTPAIQSIYSLEAIYRNRFTLYKSVVNHHAVKRTDCVLQSAIEEMLLQDNATSPVQETHGFGISTMADVLKTVFTILSTDSSSTELLSAMYKYSQINDQWLMSKLNQKFIEIFIKGSGIKDSCLFNFLEELFHNTRVFKSLWKRSEEYNAFMEDLGKALKDSVNNGEVNSTSMLSQAQRCINDLAMPELSKEGIFLFNRKLQRLLTKKTGMTCLISPLKLKSGIDINQKIFNDSQPSKLVTFSKVSKLPVQLDSDVETSIRFFVFYHDREQTELDREAIVKLLVECIISMKKDAKTLKKKKKREANV